MIIGTLAMDETTPAIKENLAKVQEVMDDIDEEHFPFLEHPGNIHFLFPSPGEEHSCTHVKNGFYNLKYKTP